MSCKILEAEAEGDGDRGQSSPVATGQPVVRRKQRHPRKPTSCEPCRRSKLRCDRQVPCGACSRRGPSQVCRYHDGRTRSSARGSRIQSPDNYQTMDRTGPSDFSGSTYQDRSTLVVPDTDLESQDFTRASWDALWQRSTEQDAHPSHDKLDHVSNSPLQISMGSHVPSTDILSLLPAPKCVDYMLIQYFTYMAPLFQILDPSAFQNQYTKHRDNPATGGLTWLSLLFAILSTTVHTLEWEDPALTDLRTRLPHADDTTALSTELRKAAIGCLMQNNFLFHPCFHILESLLLIIYGTNHDAGVDSAWSLLSLALNMGVALQCNLQSQPQESNTTDSERKRRCWAAILSLHTYQVLLFRDVDTTSLLNIPEALTEITNDSIFFDSPISQKTPHQIGNLVLCAKVRLFRITSRICRRLSAQSQLIESELNSLDSEVAEEQKKWDFLFLESQAPSVLESQSYAYWCIFQVYAHQLHLLLHRPFCRARTTDVASRYLPSSRKRCITAGAALLRLQGEFFELPRLRPYRWFLFGMISLCSIHGAMALASCFLDNLEDSSEMAQHRRAFGAAVDRVQKLQSQSPICAKAYPILRHLCHLINSQDQPCRDGSNYDFGEYFDNWMDTVQWFNPDSTSWEFWDDIISSEATVREV